MSSNIYLKNKSLDTETVTDLKVRDIEKIFSAEISAISYAPGTKIPFSTISWRTEDIEYDLKNVGKVYIPKNIHLTNGEEDYFVIQIDDKIGIYFWRDFRKADKTEKEAFSATPVSDPLEIKKLKTVCCI